MTARSVYCDVDRAYHNFLSCFVVRGLLWYVMFGPREENCVLRSVTRSKPMEGYIEPANLAPSPIKNRHCCPPPLTRSKIRRSEENLAECDHVASRTRGHLANSPRKSCLTEEFKKPLPVSEYHPRKDHPTGGSRWVSGVLFHGRQVRYIFVEAMSLLLYLLLALRSVDCSSLFEHVLVFEATFLGLPVIVSQTFCSTIATNFWTACINLIVSCGLFSVLNHIIYTP